MASTISFQSAIRRAVVETSRARSHAHIRPASLRPSHRTFTSRPALYKVSGDTDKFDSATTAGAPGESGKHEGQFARTDDSIKVEYPKDEDFPPTHPVRGAGGAHYKRTLAAFSMEGKTAIVTGGARGLGLVMAQGLIESGAHVALVDLNLEEAKNAAAGITDVLKRENFDSPSDHMPRVTAHYCDVSNEQSVKDCIADVIRTHGKIDNLVTSAGFTENFEAINYPFDRVKKLWGVNVDGTYLFATNVARHLIERKSPGSIVFIGSMSGAIVNVPQPQSPYNASKAAVRHLAASLAVEWAESGIRVNCISPGYMLTAL